LRVDLRERTFELLRQLSPPGERFRSHDIRNEGVSSDNTTYARDFLTDRDWFYQSAA
jgi:hypothetical protein